MNIAEASVAHIHIGSPSVAGPVVVGLEPPSDGSISGEVQVDEELIKAMRKNPGNYYVNVHNGRIPQALSGGNWLSKTLLKRVKQIILNGGRKASVFFTVNIWKPGR